MEAGKQYWITLTSTGDTGITWRRQNSVNVYTGGNRLVSSDGGSTWGGTADQNWLFEIWGSPQNPIVTLNFPINNTMTKNSSISFNSTFDGQSGFTLINGTLWIWNGTGAVYNNTEYFNLSGTGSTTRQWLINNFAVGSYKWNSLLVSNNSSGALFDTYATNNNTFVVGAEIIGASFSANTFETESEFFQVNVSIPNGGTISSATLIWNGTSYTGAISNTSANNYSLTRTIDIPLVNATIPFYWNVTFSNGFTQQLNTSNQNVGTLNWTLCSSAPNNVPFLNITFKDESNLSNINAQISTSTFEYFLGSGSISKNLTFINTTANPSYAFCGNPPSTTINVNPTVQYTGTGYQQRIWNPLTANYSNTTTNQVLYLLGDADGVFAKYQVFTASGSVLSGVTVNATRVIGSDTVLVGSGLTDDSGLVTLWLNPNFLHTVTFFKEGFPQKILSVNPDSSTTPVVLEADEGNESVVTDYSRGIVITLLPISDYLNNNTLYNFSYSISTSYWALDSFGFNLTYLNGTLIGSNSSSNAGGGTLSLEANSLDSRRVIMNYHYIVNGTTINGQRYWLVNTVTGYGISKFSENLGTSLNSDIFGFMGQDGTGNFGKAFLSVLVLILVGGGLSYKYGVTSQPAIMGILLGIVLMLDAVNLLPEPTLPMRIPFGDFLAVIMFIIIIITIIGEERR